MPLPIRINKVVAANKVNQHDMTLASANKRSIDPASTMRRVNMTALQRADINELRRQRQQRYAHMRVDWNAASCSAEPGAAGHERITSRSRDSRRAGQRTCFGG
jgi:hypothetical protein